MKDNKLQVSVCMITYNHELYIAQAIDSILMQKADFDVQLIIGDDCSTDKTRDICIDYQAKYPEKIKLLLPEENLGMQRNFLTTLSACNGKYIALCEGDDYWIDSEKLQKQIDFLEKNEEYSLIWCRFQTLNQQTQALQDDSNEPYFALNREIVEFDFRKFYQGWQLGIQTMVFRQSLLLSFSKEIEKYSYWKDIHLITFLLKNGKAACLNFFGAVYRIHEGGVFSGQSRLHNAKISFHCYREISKNNEEVEFLRLKFIKFAEYYIDLLIELGYYYKAIKISKQLSYYHINKTINKSIKSIYNHSIMILRNLLKSAIRNEVHRNNLRVFLNQIKNLPKKFQPFDCPDYFAWVKQSGVTSVPRTVKIVVSLTSFPPRIKQVKYAINTILNQTLKPDMVVLWLAESEFPKREKNLPKDLLKLKKFGLTIAWYKDNIKPYKKLIPSLHQFPNDIIVTVDDDVFYKPNWLEGLYLCHIKYPQLICCHRAHKIVLDKDNTLTSYNNWLIESDDHTPSFTNFMTGVGGVLYPPKCMYEEILNQDLFQKLVPSNDDIWFWGMALLKGSKIKVIENNQSASVIVGNTQHDALCTVNVAQGQNDVQLKNLFNYYPILNEIILQAD